MKESISRAGRAFRHGLAGAIALSAGASGGCLAASTSQNPPDGGAALDAGGGAARGDGGAPASGACDTAATWQVTIGGASGGGTLSFSVPAADVNGGSWSPAAGISYSFDPSSCTVTFASGGCSGIGTFGLRTGACTILTVPSCAKGPCDAGCPTLPEACTMTRL